MYTLFKNSAASGPLTSILPSVVTSQTPTFVLTFFASLFEASKREAKNVRTNVGVCDVTTLGKIDVKGPDAAEFLNRVYTNAWLKLPVGKARYGVMLREDGIVMDDGTTTRISENHYHMTTTTAQAAA